MEKPIKYDPIDRIFRFVMALNDLQGGFFNIGQNISLRGDFLSVYLPINPMLELINLLASKGYHEHGGAKDFAIKRGYSPTDFYCNIGPYMVRIALYREKLDNNHDIKWLEDKYLTEVSNLKRERDAAVSLMDYHKAQVDRLNDLLIGYNSNS